MNCFIINASNIISSKCSLCMMYAYVFVLWIWVHRCHRTHVQVRVWNRVSYSSLLSMPDLLNCEFLISCLCLSTPGGDKTLGLLYYHCATESNSYLALRILPQVVTLYGKCFTHWTISPPSLPNFLKEKSFQNISF